jgi:hypothetical protein
MDMEEIEVHRQNISCPGQFFASLLKVKKTDPKTDYVTLFIVAMSSSFKI